MVDKEQVEYVANLAKINITDEEKGSLSSQLSKVVDYIDKLKGLEVKGVTSMRGPDIQRNVFREDKVSPSALGEDILKNSPAREADYFKIPKVIE